MQVSKWGNSLAVRLPSVVVEAMGLKEGDNIEIEVAGPRGSATWEQQQAKTNQQGAISFMETTAGSIDKMLLQMISSGGKFNAKIYEGTPDKFLRAKRITDCFLQLDNADRDWENRAQVLMFSGTLFFHYYGEIIPGNTNNYR